MGYLAFELTKKSQKELLEKFPPSFDNVKMHHITYKFGISPNEKYPVQTEGYVIGYKKGDGIEALVVKINGKTTRPDGGTYHITISHDNFHKPVHSNKLLANSKYMKLEQPIKIYFKAGYFK